MTKRIRWVDGAKALSMATVIILHCKGILYTNSYINQITYWCVCTFVVLSGFTTFLADQKHRSAGTSVSYVKRALTLLGQYATASILCQIFYERSINLQSLLKHLIYFDMCAPFYFFVFFIQLVLISPLLIQWLTYCNQKKKSFIWNFFTLIFLLLIGLLCIKYTYITPTFGGGQYLFGGTYLFLYYLGMLLCSRDMYIEKLVQKKRIPAQICTFLISLAGFVTLWLMLSREKITYGLGFNETLGTGINPPGFVLILYSILSVFLFYSMFSLLDMIKSHILQRILGMVSFIGCHTLYIFIYHYVIRDFIMKLDYPFIPAWLLKSVLLISMLIVPIIIEWFLGRMKKLILPLYRSR